MPAKRGLATSLTWILTSGILASFCIGPESAIAQQLPETEPAAVLGADAKQRAEWASEWLRSEDPARVAWGAWLARQDRLKSLVSGLVEKVVEYQPAGADDEFFTEPGARDRHDAMLAVLDALIGLDGAVPAEVARKLYPEFAAQSLILLVRSREDASATLLDIARNAKANWNWLAAGNVLVKNRAPGFAALLLSKFTQHLTVSVVNSGFGSGFGGGGSECGFSMAAPKSGWPAVGLYWLTQFPERIPWLTATFLIQLR